MNNHVLALWAALTILMLWPIARILQGSWIAPGSLLAAIWSVGAFAPLIVSPDYPIYPEAYVIVLAFVLTGVLGSSLPILLSGQTTPRAVSERSAVSVSGQWLRPCYRICVALGIVSSLLLYRVARNRFDPESISDLSSMVTQARYTNEFHMPLVVTVLNSFSYLAAILGGYLATSRLSRGYKGENLAFFIPLVMILLIMTTRAVLAYGGVLFVSGAVAGSFYSGTERRFRLGWLLQRSALMIGMVFAIVMAGQLYRWASTTRQLEALAYSRVTLTGHMTALGQWYSVRGDGGRGSGMPGGLTFAGVIDKLGWGEREMGLFAESVAPDRNNGHIQTNIYTAWRGVIADFTFPGGLVFFFGLSLLGGLGTARLRAGHSSTAGLVAAFAAFALISPISSVFNYNSILLAMIAFAGLTVTASWQSDSTPAVPTSHPRVASGNVVPTNSRA